jgi:hypothetical protein
MIKSLKVIKTYLVTDRSARNFGTNIRSIGQIVSFKGTIHEASISGYKFYTYNDRAYHTYDIDLWAICCRVTSGVYLYSNIRYFYGPAKVSEHIHKTSIYNFNPDKEGILKSRKHFMAPKELTF